jgi:uncharacterized protein
MIAATTLLLLGPFSLAILYAFRRSPPSRVAWWSWAAAWFLAAGLVAPLAMKLGHSDSFGWMQSLCWALFLVLPLLLWGLSLLERGWGRVWVSAAALLLTAISLDAFFVEPRRLELSRVVVPGLPARVLLVADLQTDQVGPWEEEVFDRIIAEDADLVLFAGDYIQAPKRIWAEQAEKLRTQLLRLHPRLGALAVHGDVDPKAWKSIFEGTAVRAEEETTVVPLGAITVTMLHIDDSRAPVLGRPMPVSPQPGFHIVLGHAPDIALGKPPADLIVAGHTHGGQVRLPGIGPLLTMSQVPRSWAAGATELPGGSTLVVSRGIGMERRDAPRLRFGCRPELVVLEPE